MIDHELELAYAKEDLYHAVDRDSPDEETAKAAKASIYLTICPLRDYIADEAERRAREVSEGFGMNRQSKELPESIKLPIGIADSLNALPRELDRMGVNIRTIPESMSIEATLNRYITSVARKAWEDGTMRLSDALDEILKPASAERR